MRRLSALDAAFLPMDRVHPMSIGSVLVLEGPAPTTSEVEAHVADRLADALPARVHVLDSALRRPRWSLPARVDVPAHLHRLSLEPPGSEAQLRSVVVRLMGRRLDVTRPLWEAWIVDGLDHGRWALAVRAHHAVVDGFAGSDLVRALLDPVGDARQPPRRAARTRPRPTRRRRLALVRLGLRTVVRPDLPASPLSGPVGDRRSWAWTGCDLDAMRRTAREGEATVNDVVLAAVAGGYRRWLVRRGALPDDVRVRAIVPVSMRGPDQARAAGNIDAAIFVMLPVATADARQRLSDVAAQTRAAKDHGIPEATEAVLAIGEHVPQPLLVRAARAYAVRGQRRVNACVSHVRGPEAAMQLMGRRVTAMLPYVPVALDVRTTCAVLTYAGRATVAVTAATDGVPDLDDLVEGIAESLAELLTVPA